MIDSKPIPAPSLVMPGHACEAAVGVTHDVHDRMDDQVQGQALAGDLHGDRVDQEGHVVAGDLDDGVRALPAVLVEARVEHPHLAAGLAAGDEMPFAQHRAIEVGDRQILEVFRSDLGEEAAREFAHALRLPCG